MQLPRAIQNLCACEEFGISGLIMDPDMEFFSLELHNYWKGVALSTQQGLVVIP